jgi:putative membrane protein
MSHATDYVIGLIAVLHIYFLVLEMFLWDKPIGLRIFRLTPDSARASKALAANQGLYNGFLAAGLIWGLWLGAAGRDVKLFFLFCIVAAGLYGGLSVNRKILLVQALPAIVALLMLLVT